MTTIFKYPRLSTIPKMMRYSSANPLSNSARSATHGRKRARSPTAGLLQHRIQYKVPVTGSPERRACHHMGGIITAESGDDDIMTANKVDLPGAALLTAGGYKLYLDDREKAMLEEMCTLHAKAKNRVYEDGRACGVIDFSGVKTAYTGAFGDDTDDEEIGLGSDQITTLEETREAAKDPDALGVENPNGTDMPTAANGTNARKASLPSVSSSGGATTLDPANKTTTQASGTGVAGLWGAVFIVSKPLPAISASLSAVKGVIGRPVAAHKVTSKVANKVKERQRCHQVGTITVQASTITDAANSLEFVSAIETATGKSLHDEPVKYRSRFNHTAASVVDDIATTLTEPGPVVGANKGEDNDLYAPYTLIDVEDCLDDTWDAIALDNYEQELLQQDLHGWEETLEIVDQSFPDLQAQIEEDNRRFKEEVERLAAEEKARLEDPLCASLGSIMARGKRFEVE